MAKAKWTSGIKLFNRKGQPVGKLLVHGKTKKGAAANARRVLQKHLKNVSVKKAKKNR